MRFQTDVEEAAHVVGLSIQILRANNESEIDDAFNGLAQTQAGALLVGPGPFFDSRRDKLIALAAKAGVPAACESRATAINAAIDRLSRQKYVQPAIEPKPAFQACR